MNKTVLITGASGFIGQVLCAAMLRQGWHIKAASRTPGKYPAGIDSVTTGEITALTDWSDALRDVDVVIHLAARVHVLRETSVDPLGEFKKVNLHGTSNLARQAFQAGVKRLVYVSSVGVNGPSTTAVRPYTELDEPKPHNPYAISKWLAEQELQGIANKSSFEVVIVRPPLVYGEHAPGNFARLVKLLERGIPLPLASVKNLRSLIYVGNLVDALMVCATHPAAAGQTYLVSDGEDVSTPGLLRQLADAMGLPARLFPCPPSLLHLVGKLTGSSRQMDRLLGSLQVDSAKIRRDLNWVPPYSLQQGLQATAEWYRNQHT